MRGGASSQREQTGEQPWTQPAARRPFRFRLRPSDHMSCCGASLDSLEPRAPPSARFRLFRFSEVFGFSVFSAFGDCNSFPLAVGYVPGCVWFPCGGNQEKYASHARQVRCHVPCAMPARWQQMSQMQMPTAGIPHTTPPRPVFPLSAGRLEPRLARPRGTLPAPPPSVLDGGGAAAAPFAFAFSRARRWERAPSPCGKQARG